MRRVLRRLRIRTAGGVQEQMFIILEYVPAWVVSIDRARAGDMVKQRLLHLWEFSVRTVYDEIARTGGLPPGPSRNIEDLRDLARLDEAMTGLAERQQALEESQEKARQAWKDHEARLRALEVALADRLIISNAQRGAIYQLVQQWAQARAERQGIAVGAAMQACWAAIKGRYKVAKYEHIPASQYDDCVAYIKRAYAQVTGESLTSEQLGLFDTDV
jgi:hypothetical protein